MKKEPLVFIEHILQCIKAIREYTKNITKDEFLESEEKQDAVIRRIEIIGEAAKNLPPHVKDKFPKVPWKRMTGMRDILVHSYFGVDLNLTWKVATDDIKDLEKQIREVKKKLAK